MADPLISVIVPTYGRPEYLAEALESIKAQSYTRWEVIVVDDCSPEPVEVPEWVTLVRHRRNMGLASARNSGLARVNGDLVTFLDDDDWFHPNRFAWAVDEIGDARTHACLTYFAFADGSTAPTGNAYVGDHRSDLMRRQPPTMGQCVFRSEDVVQFNPSLRYAEDTEWWCRMRHAAVFAHHDGVGHYYRQHSASIMTTTGADLAFDCRRYAYVRNRRDLDRRSRAFLAEKVWTAALRGDRRLTAIGWAARGFTLAPSVASARKLLWSLAH